jgi:hypothetical protein
MLSYMILQPFDRVKSYGRENKGQHRQNRETQGLEPSVQLKQGKEESEKKSDE